MRARQRIAPTDVMMETIVCQRGLDTIRIDS